MKSLVSPKGKRRLIRKALLAAFLICLYLFSGNLGEKEALVIDIIDGDTVVAVTEEGEKEIVRYLLIDTPELHHPSRGEEELGREAKAFNASLVAGRKVRFELDAEKRDRYGRLLAYAWIEEKGEEKMVNEMLVEEGLALPYFIPPNGKYLDRISEAAKRAKVRNVGLWKIARKRVYTPDQVYSALPYIAGRYITLVMRVEEAKKSGSRWLLYERKSRCQLVIYDNNEHLLGAKDFIVGRKIRAIGKITASHNGAEMIISDTSQIEIEVKAKSRVSKRAVRVL